MDKNPGCLSFIQNIFTLIISKLKPKEENIYELYQLKPSLFTKNEFAFLQSLYAVIGSKFLVFSKVRLSDIIKTLNIKQYSDYLSALNKINSRHIDFLLCDPKDGQPRRTGQLGFLFLVETHLDYRLARNISFSGF